jgi:hypothetical protein
MWKTLLIAASLFVAPEPLPEPPLDQRVPHRTFLIKTPGQEKPVGLGFLLKPRDGLECVCVMYFDTEEEYCSCKASSE